MAVQAWKRRLACQWSCELLFPALSDAHLPGLYGPLPGEYHSEGYLWTVTFKEAEQRLDGKLAKKVFTPFSEFLRRSGKRFVYAWERGFKSGHFHVHLLTDQRWEASWMWHNAREYGLGNLDLQKIPISRISYVAKYIGKQKPRWPIPKKFKLWGCVGFVGIRTNNVKFKQRNLTLLPKRFYEDEMGRDKIWQIDGQIIVHKRANYPATPELPPIQMKITNENAMHLTRLLANGQILAVGEYRTCVARELKFTDDDTGKQKVRKLVEHGIELGDDVRSEQITCTEWLPDGTDIATVKQAFPKGTPVVVEIDGMSRKFGITAKSIRDLASFNGKLS
jgi:hypothetical protein